MPIILEILGNVPEELLQLADETPVLARDKLPPPYQLILNEINNQLIELYNTIINDFPQQRGHLSTVLAEAMSGAEFDQLERVIHWLYAANWIDNKKATSSLYLLNMAFTKRTRIKNNLDLSLSAERTGLEIKLDLEIEKHIKQVQRELTETHEMLTASNTLKTNMNLTQIFSSITEEVLELASQKPSPQFDELTSEQQEVLNKLGAELVSISQKIPALVKMAVNADSLLMIMAESISAPEFDPIQRKIEKLFDTKWLGKGIGIEYAALTNLYTAFMLRNAISQKNQVSLSEKINKLEYSLQQPSEANEKIRSLHRSLIEIRLLIDVSELVQKMKALPSTQKNQPQNRVISCFEEKLKIKIASLKKDIHKKNPTEKNYEAFVLNKQSKISHLSSVLKQITLYRFNAITLEDFIDRAHSFQIIAGNLSHTNSFKIFANKHIDDLFTVDTKKMLDNFHKEMIAFQSITPKLKN